MLFTTAVDIVNTLAAAQIARSLRQEIKRYTRPDLKIYKHWTTIFNNDATLTSAVLDRLLHHAETLLIEGTSYRMKDRIADL